MLVRCYLNALRFAQPYQPQRAALRLIGCTSDRTDDKVERARREPSLHGAHRRAGGGGVEASHATASRSRRACAGGYHLG